MGRSLWTLLLLLAAWTCPQTEKLVPFLPVGGRVISSANHIVVATAQVRVFHKKYLYIGMFNTWMPSPIQRRPDLARVWRQTKNSMRKMGILEKITAANVAATAVLALADRPTHGFVRRNFALQASRVWMRPWSVALSLMTHASLEHLLLNTVTLYQIGPPLVKANGEKNFLAAYCLCGLGGCLATLLYCHMTGQNYMTMGAAPCLLGLAGASAVDPFKWTLKSMRVGSGANVMYVHVVTFLSGFAMLESLLGVPRDLVSQLGGVAVGMAAKLHRFVL